jgi:hypothetical protein
MKGSREHKRYLSRLKGLGVRWFDDLYLFKLEQDAKNNRYKPRAEQMKQAMRIQELGE